MARLKHAEQAFPKLRPGTYKKTSEPTNRYNCIAWAAGEDTRWWWPDPMRTRYWPPGIPRVPSLESFVLAFEKLGYERVAAGKFEEGYQRIAIYALHGKPTHAARQLPNKKWTSKLGVSEDIEHTLGGLDGDQYGAPVLFMRRKIPEVVAIIGGAETVKENKKQ